MSDPSEHSHEYPDPAALQRQVVVVRGVVVNPGDTLVVAVDLDEEDVEWFTAKLVEKLPGISVVVIDFDRVELAAVKGPGLDVPARPLVEFREHPGSGVVMTGVECAADGTIHTLTADTGPGSGWLPPVPEEFYPPFPDTLPLPVPDA